MSLTFILTALVFTLTTFLVITIVIFKSSQKNRLVFEAKANSQHAKFQHIVNLLPDAIVILDKENTIKWSNNSANNLLNINWEQHQGIHINKLIQQPAFTTALDNAENQTVNVDVTISPLDKTINIVIIDRYLSEESVNKSLAERILVAHDISRLTKAHQTRQDFVANVSHELKTPLTVLRGYLEILNDNPKLTSQVKKPIQSMTEQSMRMQNIVDDLLYLSKLEKNNNIENHKLINIQKTIATIIEAASALNNKKNHNYEVNIDQSVNLKGNSTEIYSAFSNLIFNAALYTPDKGTIQINWGQDDQCKYLSVKDNGMGISDKHIERLTERFYRANVDRSREKGGTGLGLAIVKHVLNRHNAKLYISSTLGKGSLFRCEFAKEHKEIT